MWNIRWDNFSHFDFSQYRNDFGNSGFGLAHEPGGIIKPELPFSTVDILGVDLTHVIHTSDVAAAKGGGSGGGGGKGGSGGGSGTGFNAVSYTSGSSDGSGFNITIEFKGTWDQSTYDIFVNAADRLTSLISSDVQNVTVFGLKGGPRVIDDIVISAELTTIDGTGGILGQAGPTSIRTDGYLPATAIMQFDIADVGTFQGLGLFDDIVLHEMSHSLGFGSIWSYLGLVVDGQYIGPQAVNEYDRLFQNDGLVDGDVSSIPVETDGGSGTAGSHWDEETFINELMTGYIDGTNYFSEMSAAAFGDLGYTIVDYNALAWVDSNYILV